MPKPRGGMTLLDVVQPVTATSGDLRERFPSSPFLWWAIGLALTAGFGQGMLLVLHLAAGQPSGLWWVGAVQAHGHIQLFGWGGMFALGIGLFFLPRLRGCPAPAPQAVRMAAWLLGGGLALRALAQPTVAALGPGDLQFAAGMVLALSGLLELAGAALAVGALVVAARKGPPLAGRAALVAVSAFALTFFASLLLALAITAYRETRPTISDQHLFIGQRGQGVSSRAVELLIEKYARLAGLEDVTPHTLRHSFGKHALDAGADLVSMSALLGHQRLETTAIYTTPSQRDLEKVVEKLEQDGDLR